MVMGDLNVYLYLEEKSRGASADRSKRKELFEFMQNCSLQDMGFIGPKFAWTRGYLQERLDRGLCNGA
ncbi:hypothetical protein Syun_009799 [Stephania yunnanensis]|uniref:Uncharacterized protein n=1 Tax=Stephania yunnanensis TaxID=152371 RepID=A0AAP0KG98_9MAGN